MYLKRVTLNNFRCFEHFELELHQQLTVLVGLNGAGKTAILDGIAAALSPILRYLSSADQRLSAAGAGVDDKDFRLIRTNQKNGKERWTASSYSQVILESSTGVRWDDWKSSTKSKGLSPPDRIGKRALASYLSEIQQTLSLPSRQVLPVFSYYGAQRGSIDVPKRLRRAKHNYDHPTSALVDALHPRSDFREMLVWFEQEESSELRRNRGLPADEWELSPALQAVREAIELLLGGKFRNPHFNSSHRFIVEGTEDGAPYQISQLSQGYQAMVALAIDFARRLAVGNGHLDFFDNPAAIDALIPSIHDQGRQLAGAETGVATKFAPAIMLVDEIDLHLHPAWQQRVLTDLVRAFPGTQFIVTTHSPQVLTSVDSACIRLIHEEPDAETGKRRVVATSGFAQTKGVASSDLLAQILGVNPIPPVEEAQWVADYIAMIENGEDQSDAGLALRSKLEAFYKPAHPVLLDADRLIRFQKFKVRNKSSQDG